MSNFGNLQQAANLLSELQSTGMATEAKMRIQVHPYRRVCSSDAVYDLHAQNCHGELRLVTCAHRKPSSLAIEPWVSDPACGDFCYHCVTASACQHIALLPVSELIKLKALLVKFDMP